jgi:hypothetical protein
MATPFYFWQTVSKRLNGNPDLKSYLKHQLIYFF